MPKRFKRFLAALVCVCLVCGGVPAALAADAPDVFFDDFNGDALDSSKWIVAEKSWGYGDKGGSNGGVVPQNVSVSGGSLKLEGHGNNYTGSVPSYNNQTPNGERTGAAIATREYFASGSYEVVAKVAPVFGACSAIWTFEYEEYYPGDPKYDELSVTGLEPYVTENHEIDIEMPTANDDFAEPSFQAARFNTWTTEKVHNDNFMTLPAAQDDGAFHTYRFDWHTGGGETARVEFYIDGELLHTSTEAIPKKAGRFWLGLWFPAGNADSSGWTGAANFDTAVFEIDSVKITPFHEAGDLPQEESYPYIGWAADSFPELIEAERYNHVFNGDFSQGQTGWELQGGAAISGGAAQLKSGANTDTIVQTVRVLPNMTYTLAADVLTAGTEVTIGIRKQNGTGTISKTADESGQVVVTFTTTRDADVLVIFAEVVRYQDKDDTATVDNISLISGKTPVDGTEPPVDPPHTKHSYGDWYTVTPATTEAAGLQRRDCAGCDAYETRPIAKLPPITDPPVDPPVDPPASGENMIKNPNFTDGQTYWDTHGSAQAENGAAVLASGSDTDSVCQVVPVKGETTYTLSADVWTEGVEVSIGSRKTNGTQRTSKTVNESGRVSVTFTTEEGLKEIQTFAEVLRYQDSDAPVTVDNFYMAEGTVAHTHAYTAWYETTPAACATAAIETAYCPADGVFGTATRTGAAALNHDFSVKLNTVAPTIDDDGYTVYKCSRCAATENRDATPKLAPPKGILGTNPKWNGEWWHYLLFFFCFGFIWMWF